MRFSDLAAEREADSGPVRLGGEEGHEQVRGGRQPEAVIGDGDVDVPVIDGPRDFESTPGLD